MILHCCSQYSFHVAPASLSIQFTSVGTASYTDCHALSSVTKGGHSFIFGLPCSVITAVTNGGHSFSVHQLQKVGTASYSGCHALSSLSIVNSRPHVYIRFHYSVNIACSYINQVSICLALSIFNAELPCLCSHNS